MADPEAKGIQVETDESPSQYLWPGFPEASGIQAGTDEQPSQYLWPGFPQAKGIQIPLYNTSELFGVGHETGALVVTPELSGTGIHREPEIFAPELAGVGVEVEPYARKNLEIRAGEKTRMISSGGKLGHPGFFRPQFYG